MRNNNGEYCGERMGHKDWAVSPVKIEESMDKALRRDMGKSLDGFLWRELGNYLWQSLLFSLWDSVTDAMWVKLEVTHEE